MPILRCASSTSTPMTADMCQEKAEVCNLDVLTRSPFSEHLSRRLIVNHTGAAQVITTWLAWLYETRLFQTYMYVRSLVQGGQIYGVVTISKEAPQPGWEWDVERQVTQTSPNLSRKWTSSPNHVPPRKRKRRRKILLFQWSQKPRIWCGEKWRIIQLHW
jgi:hypothetical protein